jgi:phosphoribosyl-AMP cyclohydrolase
MRSPAAILALVAAGNRVPRTNPSLFSPQHVDTGEVLMQAYADRNAICETLQTG